mmetsp:Transcript_36706/g.63035  ORF Transcript_36706/g.63035 Transcript_36706/m.63035 type:complete len:409 (+) Transcript_36706:902-2128(+)
MPRRVAFHRVRVLLDRLRVLACLEELVPLLPHRLGNVGVDVRVLLRLLLRLLQLLQLLLHVLRAVLHERILVGVERVVNLAHRLVRVADARKRLGDDLVVGARLAPDLDGLVARGDAALVVLLLKLDGGEVVVVCHLGGQRGDGGLVVLDRLIKLFRLVRRVALLLVAVGLGLQGLGRLLLLRQLNLGLRLGLRLLRLGRWGRRAGAHALGRLDVDAHQHANHVHDARVLQVHADRLRVLLQLLELHHERRVAQVPRGPRVARNLLQRVGRAEDRAEPAEPAALVALGGGLGVGEAVGQHREPRLDGQPLLVRGNRVVEAAHPVQRRALAAVALAPSRVHLDAIVGVGQRLVVLLQTAVAGRSVAVKDVRRAQLDGLREVDDRLIKVLQLELRVAKLLLRVRHVRRTG